jgi:hypothetical protein
MAFPGAADRNRSPNNHLGSRSEFRDTLELPASTRLKARFSGPKKPVRLDFVRSLRSTYLVSVSGHRYPQTGKGRHFVRFLNLQVT